MQYEDEDSFQHVELYLLLEEDSVESVEEDLDSVESVEEDLDSVESVEEDSGSVSVESQHLSDKDSWNVEQHIGFSEDFCSVSLQELSVAVDIVFWQVEQ